jgi:hypothetical protein
MRKTLVLSLLFLFAYTKEAHSQYNVTLTKGVRMIFNRYVQTNDISSSFDSNASLNRYTYEFEASAENLEGIDNETIQSTLDLLRNNYGQAYTALSLGSYKMDVSARMRVNAYGGAYGITDKLTGYFGLPIYNANIQMNYTRTKPNTYAEVQQIFNGYANDDFAGVLNSAIENMYDIDGPTIQNLVTSQYGYAPLGSWEAQGPGDLEFGLMYAFDKLDRYGSGMMLTVGGVAPTGYVDDPDVIQDIGFGDGQWDAFVEYGGSYFLRPNVALSAFARYTYQFGAEKELRFAENRDDFLTDRTGSFYEKLGDRFLFSLGPEWIVNDWISIYPSYEYHNMGEATYFSDNLLANEYLAQDTGASSHQFRVQMQVSSVQPFLKGKFLLPLQMRFAYQSVVDGINTPKSDRFEVDFRMFF